MQSIKFGGVTCGLVTDGLQLGDEGGKVIILPGVNSFTAVEAALKTTKDIVVLDDTGEPWITRSDLVYAGRLTKDDNYVVGADTEAGTDVTGTVLIAEFRLPDVRDKVAELEAKIEYMSMMSGVDLEEV